MKTIVVSNRGAYNRDVNQNIVETPGGIGAIFRAIPKTFRKANGINSNGDEIVIISSPGPGDTSSFNHGSVTSDFPELFFKGESADFVLEKAKRFIDISVWNGTHGLQQDLLDADEATNAWVHWLIYSTVMAAKVTELAEEGDNVLVQDWICCLVPGILSGNISKDYISEQITLCPQIEEPEREKLLSTLNIAFENLQSKAEVELNVDTFIHTCVVEPEDFIHHVDGPLKNQRPHRSRVDVILNSLGSANIQVHTNTWKQNLESLFEKREIDKQGIVSVNPAGISPKRFKVLEVFNLLRIKKVRSLVQDQSQGTKLVFMSGRADPSKNIPAMLEEYLQYIKKNPSENVKMVLQVHATREGEKQYDLEWLRVQELVTKINNFKPGSCVHFDDNNHSRALLFASISDVFCAPSLADGLGLTVLEAIKSYIPRFSFGVLSTGAILSSRELLELKQFSVLKKFTNYASNSSDRPVVIIGSLGLGAWQVLDELGFNEESGVFSEIKRLSQAIDLVKRGRGIQANDPKLKIDGKDWNDIAWFNKLKEGVSKLTLNKAKKIESNMTVDSRPSQLLS